MGRRFVAAAAASWGRAGGFCVTFLLIVALSACGGEQGDGIKVVSRPVRTGAFVKAGSVVETKSTGLIDFGGAVAGIGAPKLDADGDTEATPDDYPAPLLTKNSLVCQVGGKWYQCGVDARFTPFQDGELVLAPNDGHPEDNSRGWFVKVFITPPPVSSQPGTTTTGAGTTASPTTYGPLLISSQQVDTHQQVPAGSTIHTQASGLVDFGGAVLGVGAPILGPDGDQAQTPNDYPAPFLKKNSLIVRVGSAWYQCGTDMSFVVKNGGELLIRPNDKDLQDNSRGWTVKVTVTPPR